MDIHPTATTFRKLLETIAEGVAIVDAAGTVVYANGPAERILGLKRDRISERSYNDPRWRITTPAGEPLPDEELPVARVMRENQSLEGIEMAIEQEDGGRVILSVNAAPLRDDEGDLKAVLTTFRDVSDLWRAQRSIEEHNAFLEQKVRSRTQQFERAQLDILYRLALAAEYRDDDTGEHAQRVAAVAKAIGLELGLSNSVVDRLGKAALLHDVGKIGIPDAILLKPGKLTESEFEVMKDHTIVGARILAGSESETLRMAQEIARHHHENWDGTGYRGLTGERIPMVARIVAVADVFDALSSDRHYRPAWPRSAVLEEIRAQSARKFDPRVVSAFFRLVEAGELGEQVQERADDAA